MQVLDIYAGPEALRRIREQGFHRDLFDYVLGASGGPKWFVLAGLDRVIFPDFFAGRERQLDIIGSSAGAFRFACFAQRDPFAAINRLADRYSHTVYSDKPDAREITFKGLQLLDHMLGDTGIDEIVNNPVIKAHFVVARCLGLTQFENKPMQMAGLIASAGANALKRKLLDKFYQRYFFSAPGSNLEVTDPVGMASHFVNLAHNNLAQALMASGSIPVVIEGVEDINGAPKGMYRDGGIIDYHFDLTFGPNSGLVLYPHFYKRPVPGWFDKSLKHRSVHPSSYDKVVMLVPSDEFISSLPYGKIPDRKDFESMPAEQRIAYWQTVLKETDRLGEAFMDFIQHPDPASHIQPLQFN